MSINASTENGIFVEAFWVIDTFSRKSTMSKLFCLSSEKGTTLKRKNLLQKVGKFFPFRVNSFYRRGVSVQESIKKSKKV